MYPGGGVLVTVELKRLDQRKDSVEATVGARQGHLFAGFFPFCRLLFPIVQRNYFQNKRERQGVSFQGVSLQGVSFRMRQALVHRTDFFVSFL